MKPERWRKAIRTRRRVAKAQERTEERTEDKGPKHPKNAAPVPPSGEPR